MPRRANYDLLMPALNKVALFIINKPYVWDTNELGLGSPVAVFMMDLPGTQIPSVANGGLGPDKNIYMSPQVMMQRGNSGKFAIVFLYSNSISNLG